MMLIKLNKLIIEGDNYKRTLIFNHGLNIIQGDKYSGKSVVLNLIDYTFGKKNGINPKVQKELRSNCEFVMLDLYVGNSIMTFKRDLWKNQSYIEVYFCETEKIKSYAPKILTLDEFSKFLLDIVGIPEYKLLKHIQHSKEYTLDKLSFRDLFRYIYINQHELGTPNFMGLNLYAKKNKNKVMFEVLFGFLEYDTNNLVNKIKELENERVNLEEQIKGLTSYLKEQQLIDKEEVEQTYKQLSDQISVVALKKKQLFSNVSEKERNVEHIYTKINNRINELDEKYSKIFGLKKNAELTIFQKETLINEYNNELSELLATKEANLILPKIEHHLNCPLCKQKVLFEEKGNLYDIFNINEIIGQIKNKISTAEKSIEYSKLQVKNYEKNLVNILEEKKMYEEAKNEYSQSIRTPYIPEIEALNKLIYQLSEKQSSVNEGLRIFNKLGEKRLRIEKIQEDITELKQKQKDYKISEKDKQISLYSLEKRYIGFLRSFKQKINNNAIIDKINYLPIYDSAGLQEHDSGGMLLCMQLAYLFAVLYTKKKVDDFKHPGFMMFDSISKYLGTIKKDSVNDHNTEKILDPEVFEKIYSDLSKIGISYQIIVVENTPPPNVDKKEIRYTFHNGDHGLVDFSKNEK